MLGTVQTNASISSGSVTITLSQSGRATDFTVGARIQFLISGALRYGTVSSINSGSNQVTISTSATGTISASTIVSEISESEYQAAYSANYGGTNIPTLPTTIEWAAADAYHPIAYGAIGDGSTDDSTTLNALWNTTMSAGGYCIIDRTYSIQNNITVPVGVTIVFVRGGKFDIANTKMVSINGQIDAGPYEIFTGTGTVKFISGTAILGVPPRVYPEWWGARKAGGTATINVAAVNAAIASLDGGHATFTGGVVFFTAGKWSLDATINIGYDSIILQGSGQQNTQLDFESQTSGNGIELTSAAWCKIRDLEVKNAVSNGIAFIGSWNNIEIESVRVEASGGNGVYLEHGFLGTFKNVFSGNSGGSGWRSIGYNTSLTFISCYGNGNVGSGFDFGDPSGNKGITYSSFVSCAADGNGVHGYRIRGTGSSLPVSGISFVACGAESNAGTGWFLDTGAGTTPSIIGVTLLSCFGYNNNSNTGWSNFLYAKDNAAGSVIDQVTMIGCRGTSAAGGSYTVVANGSAVKLLLDNCSWQHGPAAVNGAVIYNRDVRQTYSVTNAVTDRAYNANATTVDELADVLASLIVDLRAKGIVA